MENGFGIREVYLEQALEELEVLRVENETLKQKLNKALSILRKIRELLEK